MSDSLKLSAELRDRVGKGASRALRRDGRVPAVIYGDNQPAVPVHIEERALIKGYGTGHFMNSIVMVEVDGKEERTLPKDVAFHPVTDRPLHVDFIRLGKDATVEVAVPVRFMDEALSPGLKRGGVLNIVRHELELVCDASRIPDDIEINLEGLEVGDSIHISHVTLPEGSVSAITDRDFTIATIVAPSALKSSDGDSSKGGADDAAASAGEGGDA